MCGCVNLPCCCNHFIIYTYIKSSQGILNYIILLANYIFINLGKGLTSKPFLDIDTSNLCIAHRQNFSPLYQNMPLSRKMCRLNIDDDVLEVFFPLYKMIFCLGIHKTVILIRISEPSYSVFKNNSFWYSSWQFYLHTIFMKLNYIRIIVVLGFKIYNV